MDSAMAISVYRAVQIPIARGYVEGQNLAIEFRWADNQLDRFVAGAAAFTRLAHLRSLSSISSMARPWRRFSSEFNRSSSLRLLAVTTGPS